MSAMEEYQRYRGIIDLTPMEMEVTKRADAAVGELEARLEEFDQWLCDFVDGWYEIIGGIVASHRKRAEEAEAHLDAVYEENQRREDVLHEKLRRAEEAFDNEEMRNVSFLRKVSQHNVTLVNTVAGLHEAIKETLERYEALQDEEPS